LRVALTGLELTSHPSALFAPHAIALCIIGRIYQRDGTNEEKAAACVKFFDPTMPS
jgi:hypothetical protein